MDIKKFGKPFLVVLVLTVLIVPFIWDFREMHLEIKEIRQLEKMVKQESDLTNRELVISFDQHKATVSEADGYEIMTRDFPYLEKATLLENSIRLELRSRFGFSETILIE